MPKARPSLDDQRVLYDRIGTLLFENQLEPTPENYALGHRYLSADDADFASLVDRAIEQSGGLTTIAVAAILAQRNTELSATDLARVADDAQAHLEQIVGVIGRSGEDAQGYGAALRMEAADLAAGAAPQPVVESLINLTRTMIEKTRVAEEHLRKTRSEIMALRDELASASHSANSDALTGLPNRRAMDTRLRTAIEAARRTGQPLSLVICDIDNFKAFNDLHGHQIGDEVIKFVADTLARDNGDWRFVARYGGEEFVLLFEGLEPADAANETERLRAQIAARELKVTATGRSLGKLAVSAGVTALRKQDSPTSLLKRADGALYRAKRGGRNRVCIAEEDSKREDG
jgi:diguanylate cyclase